MKQKILLVGANGYIGSQLYKKLNHKFDICPIDNFFRKTKKQKTTKKVASANPQVPERVGGKAPRL